MIRFGKVMIGWLGCSMCLPMFAQEMPEVSPSVYLYGIYGTSSAEDPSSFAPGGHDPQRKDALMLQSLEPALSLKWGDHLAGFTSGLAYTDERDDLEWEWEEYFLKLTDLPGGLELRGGRMLNRLGFQNATHLHSWNTVDAPLAHALFLGEDGLATEGGDISLYLDTPHPTVLTLGYGQRPAHDHDHGHGEDHEDEEHHDHDPIEGFEAFRVQDDVLTLGIRRDQVLNDFHVLGLTAFGGMGENEQGGDAWFAGVGTEVRWRENGLEPGGRALTWRTTAMRFRGEGGHLDHDDHAEEEEEHADEHLHAEGDLSTWGLHSQVVFEASERIHPFARIDYVAAADSLELPEWIRYSLGTTVRFPEIPGTTFRLQANADDRGGEQEQSLWLQVGFGWGSGEVR